MTTNTAHDITTTLPATAAHATLSGGRVTVHTPTGHKIRTRRCQTWLHIHGHYNPNANVPTTWRVAATTDHGPNAWRWDLDNAFHAGFHRVAALGSWRVSIVLARTPGTDTWQEERRAMWLQPAAQCPDAGWHDPYYDDIRSCQPW